MITKARGVGLCAVISIGFLQMAGWILQSDTLQGLGFITNASPLPLVFSIFRGIEPFSSQFTLTVVDSNGQDQLIPVSPEAYAKLEGPYNLRNVYGAVFAGGPKFTSEKEIAMWNSIMKFGFCSPAVVSRQFGLASDIAEVRVTQVSRARGIDGQWQQAVRCQE